MPPVSWTRSAARCEVAPVPLLSRQTTADGAQGLFRGWRQGLDGRVDRPREGRQLPHDAGGWVQGELLKRGQTDGKDDAGKWVVKCYLNIPADQEFEMKKQQVRASPPTTPAAASAAPVADTGPHNRMPLHTVDDSALKAQDVAEQLSKKRSLDMLDLALPPEVEARIRRRRTICNNEAAGTDDADVEYKITVNGRQGSPIESIEWTVQTDSPTVTLPAINEGKDEVTLKQARAAEGKATPPPITSWTREQAREMWAEVWPGRSEQVANFNAYLAHKGITGKDLTEEEWDDFKVQERTVPQAPVLHLRRPGAAGPAGEGVQRLQVLRGLQPDWRQEVCRLRGQDRPRLLPGPSSGQGVPPHRALPACQRGERVGNLNFPKK